MADLDSFNPAHASSVPKKRFIMVKEQETASETTNKIKGEILGEADFNHLQLRLPYF